MKSMPASNQNPQRDSPRDDSGEDRSQSTDDRGSDRGPSGAIPSSRWLGISPEARRSRELKETRIGWKMAALGWEFSSQVVAGVLLGWGADYLFPAFGHWGVICGAVAGILVGTTTFLRSALKLNNELESPMNKHGKNGEKNG